MDLKPELNAANRILDGLRGRRQILLNERVELQLQQARIQGGIDALNDVIDLVDGGRIVGLPKPEDL